MRAAMETEDVADLVLKRSPWSSTGFVNVIKVKEKFQARLQVPGDGRGGEKKRKQHSLPGLFDTALEAAIHLAVYKKALKEAGEAVSFPPKQNKQHKPRKPQQPQPAAAPPPVPMALATAMAMPICMPMMHVPFAAVSPLPMQPLCYMPRV